MKSVNKRLIQFEKDFKDVDLSTYFQLKNTNYDKIKIYFELHDSTLYLIIHYTIKGTSPQLDLPQLDLPIEINAKIRSYLTYTLELKLKMIHTLDYPFFPPIWVMSECKNTIPCNYDLSNYFSYKVNRHNFNYKKNNYQYWSPAIIIEKDILTFINTINHFDEMFIKN